MMFRNDELEQSWNKTVGILLDVDYCMYVQYSDCAVCRRECEVQQSFVFLERHVVELEKKGDQHGGPAWIIPKHQIGAAGRDEEGRITVRP